MNRSHFIIKNAWSCYCFQWNTVKFWKYSQGLYFSKALFEGLIFGGAYLRREICVSKSIGLALYLEVNLPFLLCFTLYLRAIFQVQALRGLIFGGAIWVFLRYQFGGPIFGGAYTMYMDGLIFGILKYVKFALHHTLKCWKISNYR